MKLRLEEISKGQEEVIVRYRQMNATVQAICELVQEDPKKLLVETDLGSQYVLVDDLLYFESIDGKTFAYTLTTSHWPELAASAPTSAPGGAA